MEKSIAGKTVEVNEEGYMLEYQQWDKEIGLALAQELEIALSEKHWKLIDYIRKEYKKESPLSIRKIGKSKVVSIKELYELFSGGPLKNACLIAGLPKPVSCI